MRITKELLFKYVHETIRLRKRSEADLHAAYLIGSLLRDEPLLGGITDIDLVLVHKYKVPQKREVEPLTQDLSLDIYHTLKDDYDQYRHLRQDPWLGYPLTKYNIVLFDSDHWLEFIQATVNAEFHRADNVLVRVKQFLSDARSKWFSLMQIPPENQEEWLHTFLQSVEMAANAAIGLIGPPLTTRRFMMDFNQQLETLGVPKIYAGLKGLLGLSEDTTSIYSESIDVFEQDFDSMLENEQAPIHLSANRKGYYLNAIRAFSESGTPDYASWPLLRTWLDVRMAAKETSPMPIAWKDFLEAHHLAGETAQQKIAALDAFLDNTEVLIETWEGVYGG